MLEYYNADKQYQNPDKLKELNNRIKEIRGKVKKDTYQGFTTRIGSILAVNVFNMMYSSTEVEGGNVLIVYFKEAAGSRAKALVGGKNREGSFEFAPTVKIYPYSAKKTSPIASRAVHKF